MKKHFSTGLVCLLPFVVTFLVVRYLLDAFTNPFLHLIENGFLLLSQKNNTFLLDHQAILKFFSRCIALVFTFFFIIFVGFLGRRFLFHQMMKFINDMISKIPMIGGIYQIIKDLANSFLSSDKKLFQRVVLIPFPHKDSYTMGFITGSVPHEIKNKVSDIDVVVFIPTAPHPISGYIVFSSQREVREIDVSVEDVFKFLLSCGAIHSEQKL